MSLERFYVSKVVFNPTSMISYQTLVKGPLTQEQAVIWAQDKAKERENPNIGFSVLELIQEP